jgi:TPR repeat protein
VAAPDHPAAADWFRRAADAGDPNAAQSLCHMYTLEADANPRLPPV